MKLSNDFTVNASAEETWKLLTDLERVARCMPGASLQDFDGERYSGSVHVKVGPVAAKYHGVAWFIERDEAKRTARVRAEGKDGGQGNASATIHATLQPDGDATRVVVDTDLAIAGRLAQFGRGAMADVSSQLMKQFANNLAADLSRDAASAAPPSGPEASIAPMEVGGLIGQVVLRRLTPVAALLAVFGIGLWIGRRSHVTANPERTRH